MIYEGVNVPCTNSSAFPSTFVKVDLAGRSVCTRAIENSLNPCWYEAFELEVPLPQNRALAPDVTVGPLLAVEVILEATCRYSRSILNRI